MRLIHYTATPFVFERRIYTQKSDNAALKPVGLWLSVEGADDWNEHGREMFGDDGFQYAALVTLSAAHNVLHLKTARQIDDFTEQYLQIADERFPTLTRLIDWNKVAAEYQGVIIAPYQFSRRHTMHTFWYYGWDCASGCIWDVDAIQSVAELVQQ